MLMYTVFFGLNQTSIQMQNQGNFKWKHDGCFDLGQTSTLFRTVLLGKLI